MSTGRRKLTERRSLPTKIISEECEDDVCDHELKDVSTQTLPVSLRDNLEKFEEEVQLITSMTELRYGDALRQVNKIMASTVLTSQENFKYRVIKIECHLHLLEFIEARDEGAELMEMCANQMQVSEIEIASVAFKSREIGEFTRALLYYQCSLYCWLRDMRNGKIRKRTIEVINRGEKFALTLSHLGLCTDLRGIVYEYGLPAFQHFVQQYEIGPSDLEVHRDLSIMGCCYHVGSALKKICDFEKSIECTKEGINIGMKTMKEHKNYLLPKSHCLVAECYLEIKDFTNAKRWFDSALALCPFIVNWDFQSNTEVKKDFENNIHEHLKRMKRNSQAA